MSHPVWVTKEGRRARAVLKILKWPFAGALFASGSFLMIKIFGPPIMRDLGDDAGEGFGKGLARANEFKRSPVMGRWIDGD
jgi:hypothetical protein